MASAERSRSRPHHPRGFPLRLPVRYRIGGETRWRSGLTERISEIETVIRAPYPATTVAPVTFIISLPSTSADPGGCLVGSGRIKRTRARRRDRGRSVFAVTVTRCRLDRTDRAFSRRRMPESQR